MPEETTIQSVHQKLQKRLWRVLAPFAWRCLWGKLWMRLFGVRVPWSCTILGRPNMWHMSGKLKIGERVRLNSTLSAYAMGQSMPCLLATSSKAWITIGDDTSINGAALCAADSITIGKRVLIAADCRIVDHDGHDVENYPRPLRDTCQGEAIVIEDDVWLCTDVMVCKGVTIGKGSVIGAKSLVTHDIPPDVLAAGVPARVIRPLRLEGKA